MTLDDIEKICDEQGFWINKDDEMFGINEPGWEIGKSTPEGEDWFETIATDNADVFINKLKDRIDGWDSEEEAMPYIEMRGTRGVPESIKTLLEDADWKLEQLKDLLDAIKNFDNTDLKEEKELIAEEKLNFIENVDELPDMCYGVLPSDNSIIIIKKGEQGYYITDYNDMVEGESYDERSASADEVANKLNAEMDITPDQRFTMEIRSMNGNWKSKATESKKLTEQITDEEISCAETIADKVYELGIMNWTEVDDMICDILKLSEDDIKAQDIANNVYGCMTVYNGLRLNYSTGDFYTDEYAEEHPEVLEESKSTETNFKDMLVNLFKSVVSDNNDGYYVGGTVIGISKGIIDSNGEYLSDGGYCVYTDDIYVFQDPEVEGEIYFGIQAPNYIKDKDGNEYGDYIYVDNNCDLKEVVNKILPTIRTTEFVDGDNLAHIKESKKVERNLTRAERYNKNMDNIFNRYNEQINKYCEFLRRLGYSEDKIEKAKQNTGLGAHELWDLAQPEAEKLGPDVWNKLNSNVSIDEIIPKQ